MIAVPVTRKDAVNLKYLAFAFVIILGVLLRGVAVTISAALHENVQVHFSLWTKIMYLSTVTLPLITAGLYFPLSCTKAGSDRKGILLGICVLIAFLVFLHLGTMVRNTWNDR